MKKFEMAEMEIEKIEVVDIITNSPAGCASDSGATPGCPSAMPWG